MKMTEDIQAETQEGMEEQFAAQAQEQGQEQARTQEQHYTREANGEQPDQWGQETPPTQADEPREATAPPPRETPLPQPDPAGQELFHDSPMAQQWQDRQEDRRARQEQRRAQQERQAQERHQAKEAAQEAHRARQQEKREWQQAQWDQRQADRQQQEARESPRRLGTLTLGLTLVAAGAVMLAYLILPGMNLSWLGWLAPVILMLLGAEILIRYLFAKGRQLRYDLLGSFFAMVLVGVCLVLGSSHQWMPYISPARQLAEQQLQAQLEDQVYELLKDQAQIADLRVNAYVSPAMTMEGDGMGSLSAFSPNIMATANGGADKGYAITDAMLQVTLIGPYESKEAFGADCHRVMERLARLDVLDQVYFEDNRPEEGEQYQLTLRGKFQRQMGVDAMVSQVEVYTPRQPDPELPRDDYWALVDLHGQQATDQWLAWLVSQRQEYLAANEPPEVPEELFELEDAPVETAAP